MVESARRASRSNFQKNRIENKIDLVMEIKIKTYCNGIMPTRSTDGAIGLKPETADMSYYI